VPWREFVAIGSVAGQQVRCMLLSFLSRLALEEERDSLKEQCFHAQTELTKLRSSDNMRRDG
jgi:hypothetical protein